MLLPTSIPGLPTTATLQKGLGEGKLEFQRNTGTIVIQVKEIVLSVWQVSLYFLLDLPRHPPEGDRAFSALDNSCEGGRSWPYFSPAPGVGTQRG
jgi:hypothetical protein